MYVCVCVCVCETKPMIMILVVEMLLFGSLSNKNPGIPFKSEPVAVTDLRVWLVCSEELFR